LKIVFGRRIGLHVESVFGQQIGLHVEVGQTEAFANFASAG
jgi:hypothetical protein